MEKCGTGYRRMAWPSVLMALATGCGVDVANDGAGEPVSSERGSREVVGTHQEELSASEPLVDCTGETGFDPVQYCRNLGFAEADIIIGTAGADPDLSGDGGADCIIGLAGADTIEGGGGNDIIFGGPGNDIINAGDGNDEVFGEGEDDTISAGLGDDTTFGGPGADAIQGGSGADRLSAGAGDDRVFGGPGIDRLYGGLGDDVLEGDDPLGLNEIDTLIDCNGVTHFNRERPPSDGGDTCRVNGRGSTNECDVSVCGLPRGSAFVSDTFANLGSVQVSGNDLIIAANGALLRIPKLLDGPPATLSAGPVTRGFEVASGFVYFSPSVGTQQQQARVLRVPVGGGPTTVFANTASREWLQVAGSRLLGVDMRSDVVGDSTFGADPIVSMPLNGTAPVSTTAVFSEEIGNHGTRGYVASCGRIYYQNQDNRVIRSRPVRGGAFTNLTPVNGETIEHYAANTTTIVVASRSALYRIAKATGASTLLERAPAGSRFGTIMVDEQHVYYFLNRVNATGQCAGFELYREQITVPSVPERFRRGETECGIDLAQDDLNIYYTLTNGGVRRQAK